MCFSVHFVVLGCFIIVNDLVLYNADFSFFGSLMNFLLGLFSSALFRGTLWQIENVSMNNIILFMLEYKLYWQQKKMFLLYNIEAGTCKVSF